MACKFRPARFWPTPTNSGWKLDTARALGVVMNRETNAAPGPSLISLSRITSLLLLVLAAIAVTPRANATAIAISSLQLASLTITPSSGWIIFSPTAEAFAQAQNSLGELVADYNTGVIVNSSASVTWASASSSADSISRNMAVFSNVNIPGEGAASAIGIATLYDYSFSITGTTGPVSVQFDAMLPFMQFLMTDAYGLEASSDLVFYLGIDGTPVLFKDSPEYIGPNSSFFSSGTWSLSNSVILMANQPYILYAEVDDDPAPAPEPATLSLLLGGVLCSFVARRLRSARS